MCGGGEEFPKAIIIIKLQNLIIKTFHSWISGINQ